MRRLMLALAVAGAVVMVVFLSAASASVGAGQSSIGQWRVLSVMPSTSQFWAVDKAVADGTGGVEFPFAQFESTTTGSFAVYLTHNYNVDLTGATITATAKWTSGTYYTRGPSGDGAYARIEFQDVSSGQFTSSDYWWYHGTLDLNGATSGTITASLNDRADWSNICGQFATDTTPHPGPNCVGGTDPDISPYDGFTNAMKKVKEVNLSFGRGSAYASGVAAVGTSSAIFDLTGFEITP